MSTKRPIPHPDTDWRAWAQQLVNYLRAVQDTREPEIVQLEHKNDDARATQDGLMMYDPVLGQPVFSKNGAWHTFGGA